MDLVNSLSRLLDAARSASLDLDTPGASQARLLQAEACDQISDYVLPRLVQLDAPLLVVVGGSTGAGKSTLVNALVGELVTEPGVLRPTTRSPVLVHHPHDADWFAANRMLPDLPRAVGTDNAEHALRLVQSARVPRGLAIVDAPDFDSVDEVNRRLSAQLLAAADMWLLATSAARYADEVPWSFLRKAVERNTAVAVVLDRTDPDAVAEVRGHLARMMTSRGLEDSPLFTIPESQLENGMLPRGAAAPIISWLRDLAADETARRMVIGQTLDGAIRHNVYRLHDVADAMDAQAEASTRLTRAVTASYRSSAEQMEKATRDGTLVTGPLLARWQEYLAGAEVPSSLDAPVSRLRRRVSQALKSGETGADAVREEVEFGLFALLSNCVAGAADAALQDVGAGADGLLNSQPELSRVGRDSADRIERAVRAWSAEVRELVRGNRQTNDTQGAEPGTDADAVALMIAMLDGARAKGNAAVAMGLLGPALGDATSSIVRAAHADLVERAAVLLEDEENRFLRLLAPPDSVRAQQAALREAAQRTEYARHVEILEGRTA